MNGLTRFPTVPIYYLAKPQPRERTWKNQRGKKTLLSLTTSLSFVKRHERCSISGSACTVSENTTAFIVSLLTRLSGKRPVRITLLAPSALPPCSARSRSEDRFRGCLAGRYICQMVTRMSQGELSEDRNLA
ncbi:hypothetical protein JTE90_015583 [Oedothorax gibbosus]|uniref:Uncharacterized protein n=1 Tax=Oedothorax gibbosus TaxID=931172 RepID=A0AAV6TJQ7_9ARAC|nr:hypothetical protein JTE90_015583 [Oedothorax gibbosus]